jgi:hypothetical protein
VGIFWSVVGILVSGGAGGVAGWWIIGRLGLAGPVGAIAAAVIAMGVATGVWIALTVGLRRLGLVR